MASVLDLIKHYQHAIEKYSKDEERVLRCIDKLYNLKVTTQHLQETGVGRTVNALRKEPGDVGKAARSLVYKWKMMVASEESDQEEDHKTDSSKHNGHGSGKESDDNAQVKVKQEQHQHNSSSKTSHRDDKDMNGHHSGNKRRYHSSEEEEPDLKKTRKYSSSEDDKKKVVIKKERLSDSESNDEDSDSSESDSDSDSSESSGDRIQVKNEIKQEVVVKQEKTESPERHKQSKHSHRDHNSSSRDHSDHQRESSSSKRSHNSEKQSSSHYSSKSKDSNYTKHSSESKSSSNNHKSSHEKHIDEKKHSSEEKKYNSEDKKHSSDEKKHKSDHKSEDKKESKSSSSKHSADKHKSSSNKHETSTDKHKISTEKHSSKEKHKSSLSLEKDDKHRSLEKESKSKSKENSVNYSSSSSSKEKHSSSSKDKSRDGSSKEKSSSDKKHSSSESKSVSKSKHDRSDEKSTEKKSKDSSRSSHKSKSSSSSKEDVPKKKSKKSSEDIDGGIDCGSGASFAEALGMVSPAKPKKKSFRDLSPSVNDLSPAALLAPTAKLAPLPSLEITALPEISANYKPRPPPKLLPHFSDEDAISAGISSKNQRTKVYSGNKVIGKVTSLYEMCVHILQEHIDALEYTGGVPYEILKPVVDRATPQQLFLLEHYNPYLMEDTDHLWQKFCEKNFRNKKRQEMETWREMYMRCQEEQECKLKSLTANIRIAQEAKKAPIKQTKMAYVDSVVKPPRNIARKQAVHGTAFAAAGSPASRVAALSSSANVLRGGARPPPVAISTSSSFKPKKAPLMAKALQFMRGRKR